jgi:WD40 repeat protein
MSLSPDGASLLTNSMDKSLITWDVRPFVTGSRYSKTLVGGQHNLEKTLLKCSWSGDGEMVSCGSSDHIVHIWDEPSGEELYHLPGHAGSVNEVRHTCCLTVHMLPFNAAAATCNATGCLSPNGAHHRIVRQRQAHLPRGALGVNTKGASPHKDF